MRSSYRDAVRSACSNTQLQGTVGDAEFAADTNNGEPHDQSRGCRCNGLQHQHREQDHDNRESEHETRAKGHPNTGDIQRHAITRCTVMVHVDLPVGAKPNAAADTTALFDRTACPATRPLLHLDDTITSRAGNDDTVAFEPVLV